MMTTNNLRRLALLAAFLITVSAACVSDPVELEAPKQEFPIPDSYLVVGKTIENYESDYLFVYSVEYVAVSDGHILAGDNIERFHSQALQSVADWVISSNVIPALNACFIEAKIGELLPKSCK